MVNKGTPVTVPGNKSVAKIMVNTKSCPLNFTLHKPNAVNEDIKHTPLIFNTHTTNVFCT